MRNLLNKYKLKIKNLKESNKLSDYLNIIICISIIFFFFIGMFFTSNGGFSEEEKRDLASFPKLSETSLKEFFNGTYFSKINDFYQDNFVNREKFLTFYEKIDSLKGVEGEIKMTVAQDSSTVDASSKDKNNKKEDESDEDLYKNVEQVGTLLSIDNIVCEAYNCIYNKDLGCTADNVNINSHYSSCETFKCK